MADTIRVSHEALKAIPVEHQKVLHRMYEDNDVPGADDAEDIFNFIERQAPGTFVLVLANDSVSPPCTTEQMHFHCDHYAPYWYTVLIPADKWEMCKADVMRQDQLWKDAHACRVVAQAK